MTPKSPTTRASHLALLVALLFGIVAMHSLGHPREHGASAERATGGGHAGVAAGGHAGAAAGDGHARGESGDGYARGESGDGYARGESGDGYARGESGGGHARGVMAVGPVDVGPAGLSPTAVGPAAGAVGPAAGDPTGGHDSGMDPLSVCLAVLGAALSLALLHAAVRHRPWAAPAHVPGLARLLDGLRPNPPPPRALLTRLAVLRV
ncbi:hypothetical protein SMD44_02467 [Streptomyces alboflavus]|uniref:Uncharacterized protein n=1 Tax=Streptomyces alboflavus TaxID=67267 RepID=A0A1Z1W9B8_9ACTN|nr:hypothetical protein [Streptomyces alboflavus]ARX83053.1 hypothetical protein SMD44_02467 [Streptomyces alboflavus]